MASTEVDPFSFASGTQPTVGNATREPDKQTFSFSSQTLYLLTGSVGVVGNLFVIVVLTRSTALMKKTSARFIVNQSAIDLIVSVLLVSTARSSNRVPFTGIAGEILCRVWNTKLFLWGFMLSSTYNLVALSVERYLEVLHALWHMAHFTPTVFKWILVSTWLFGPLVNMYKIPTCEVVNGTCRYYTRYPSVAFQRTFGVILIVIQFFIPLLFLIFCYSSILVRLHNRSKVKPSTGANQTGRPNKWSNFKRNTIKTTLTLSISFIFCWIWNQIYFLLLNLGYPLNLTNAFYHFTVTCVFMNSCINPFIYCMQYRDFQKAVRDFLFKTRQDHSNPSELYHISHQQNR